MKSVLLSVFWSLAFLPPAVFAQEPVDDGSFSRGEERAPNQDSESVPGLGFAAPSYAGTGCPAGSVSVSLSPDQKTLSLLFDQYVIRAGGDTGAARGLGQCQVRMPFNVPDGYQVQVVKIDYRGFAFVPRNGQVRVQANLGHEERTVRRGLGGMKRLRRGFELRGPADENFILSSVIQGPSWSPCGQSFTLVSDSSVQAASNPQLEEVFSALDSADAVAEPLRISFRWKRCGSAIGGPRPRPPNQAVAPCWGPRCSGGKIKIPPSNRGGRGRFEPPGRSQGPGRELPPGRGSAPGRRGR